MNWHRLFTPAETEEQPDVEHRRLLAIMVADIVGYSKLMAHDEAAAFRRVRDLQRDVFTPAVVMHDGAIIKWTGDGFIASFPNAVNAVRAGAEIHSRIQARGAQEVSLRIGINTGDTIVTHDDVYGDSVNVAARLQALAQAGEIVVSRSVRDAVKQDVSVLFDALGSQMVKNIPEPIDTFRARIDPTARPQSARRAVVNSAARRSWIAPVAVGLGIVGAAIAVALLVHRSAAITPAGTRSERPSDQSPSASAPPVDGARDDGDEKAAGGQFFTLVNREVRVGRSWQIDPNSCEARTPPNIQVAKQPNNGRLDIRQAEFALPGGSATCKGKPARGLEIYYVPNVGFTGQDHFSYRVVLSKRNIDHDGSVTIK